MLVRRLTSQVAFVLNFLLLYPGLLAADSTITKARTVTRLADNIYEIRHPDAPDTFPQGNTTVIIGEQSVLVRLSIAALEGSLPITLPLEVVGLPPELKATLSPASVELLLTGPLPLLNNLTPGGIRISVNLTGLEVGVHQVAPVVDLLPSQVKVASILPESVEVTISVAPTPGTGTPTGVITPLSRTPTPTP